MRNLPQLSGAAKDRTLWIPIPMDLSWLLLTSPHRWSWI